MRICKILRIDSRSDPMRPRESVHSGIVHKGKYFGFQLSTIALRLKFPHNLIVLRLWPKLTIERKTWRFRTALELEEAAR